MNTRARARYAARESVYRNYGSADPDYYRERRIQDASYTDVKISKRDARYRLDTEGDPCRSCESFIRSGTCSKVEGSISPRYTCDLYEWNAR